MAQHDYNIANATGATVRADINNVLNAIVSQNSSTTEPSTTFAYMLWADTTSGNMKIRNAANTAWITLYNLATGGANTLDGLTSTVAELNILDGVTTSTTELNYVNGVTSNIQTQFDNLIVSGTRMVFVQAAAPTGWTQVTGFTGRGIRLTDGAGGGTAGTSDAFASHLHTIGAHGHGDTFAASGTALTVAQLPSHRHWITNNVLVGSEFSYGGVGTSMTNDGSYTDYTGSGDTHTHTITGSVSNSTQYNSGSFVPKYVNAIVCSKD